MEKKKSDENIIKPAVIPSTIEEINGMSPEDFQRTLLQWFEEHGVVSDLRTHLRRNMVDFLRNTPLGHTVNQVGRNPLSTREQVINLLVAEFLMRNKYQFSLSVFSSEVPFLSVLPHYLTNSSHMNPNLTIPSSTVKTEPSLRPTFTDNYFWDILDTLGFARDSVYAQKLHEFYYNTETNDSLLVGMLRLLASICNVKNTTGPFRTTSDSAITRDLVNSNIEPWLKDTYNLLMHFEVPDEIILNLHEHLKSLFEKEHAKIRTEESTKFNLLHSQIQSDFQTREAEICRMINEMENTFYKEKQKITSQVEEEQEKLTKMQRTVQIKNSELDDRLETLSRKEELLQERENEVLAQTDVLKTRIRTMQTIYDSFNNSNDGVKVQLPPEYENLRLEIQETRESIQIFNQTVSQENASKQKESEELLLKGMLERLETENAQLRNYNIQQQSRVDELTLRNSVLMTELENCQTTINILARNRQNNTITVPPLTAPPSNRSSPPVRSPTNYLSGGGETTGFNPRPPSPPPSFRNLLQAQSRDARRKASRRIIAAQNQDQSSTEESPADDILQRARQRLRRLEQETSIVDHDYRSFKQRYAQNVQNSMNDLMHNQRPPSRAFVSIGNSNSFRTQAYPPRSNSDDIRQNQPQFGSLRVVPDPNNSSTETYEFTFANPTVTHPVNYPPNVQFNELNHPGAENTRPLRTNYESEAENYRSSGHSPASTNILPQLQNLSLSSVELSSDNPENTENNFNAEEN